MFTGYFLSLVWGAGESGTENSKILGFDPHINDMWSLNLVYPPTHTTHQHGNTTTTNFFVVASFTCGWIVASQWLVLII